MVGELSVRFIQFPHPLCHLQYFPKETYFISDATYLPSTLPTALPLNDEVTILRLCVTYYNGCHVPIRTPAYLRYRERR